MAHHTSQVKVVITAVLALLTEKPMTSRELSAATNVTFDYMRTILWRERMKRTISCAKGKSGHLVFYIGDTAPKPLAVEPKPKTRHSIPVKTVVLAPLTASGEDGKSYCITLPAAPWEVHA